MVAREWWADKSCALLMCRLLALLSWSSGAVIVEAHVQVQAFTKMQHNKARLGQPSWIQSLLCLCTACPRCWQKSLGAGKGYAPRWSHKHYQRGEKHSETWRTLVCKHGHDKTKHTFPIELCGRSIKGRGWLWWRQKHLQDLALKLGRSLKKTADIRGCEGQTVESDNEEFLKNLERSRGLCEKQCDVCVSSCTCTNSKRGEMEHSSAPPFHWGCKHAHTSW